MDEVQVDVVEAETFEGGLEGAFRPSASPWSSIHSFVVMNSSSRGTPLALIARPTASSFPYERGGVERAVAGVDRVDHGLFGLIGGI